MIGILFTFVLFPVVDAFPSFQCHRLLMKDTQKRLPLAHLPRHPWIIQQRAAYEKQLADARAARQGGATPAAKPAASTQHR